METVLQELQIRQDSSKPIIGSHVITPNLDGFSVNTLGVPGLSKLTYPVKPNDVVANTTVLGILSEEMPDGIFVWSTPVAS